ncbi:MAG TPA: hypothetical protein V6D19_17355 [Stenomitos sp.]
MGTVTKGVRKCATAMVAMVCVELGSATALRAAELFELKPDQSTAPAAQTLASGPIKVQVEAQRGSNPDLPEYTLSYRIFHNDRLQVQQRTSTWSTGTVELKDLDRDAVPETIVSTYSGGAHCCMSYMIYGWHQNRLTTTKLGPLDGGGGQFKDLDGNGTVEFASVDNAFLYAFDSYAGSYPPSRIYQYKAGKLINVTRRYPKVLRSQAWDMYQSLNRPDNTSVNGVLAGYVAQKILLGEFQQGWNLMLARYDRKSDWGLEQYKGDKVVGKHANFPAALKAFLIRTGYLDRTGQPISVDR